MEEDENLQEYGDHETQAQGGMVSSSHSSDPELDHVADIVRTVIEQGGSLHDLKQPLEAEAYDVSATNRFIIVKTTNGDIGIASAKNVELTGGEELVDTPYGQLAVGRINQLEESDSDEEEKLEEKPAKGKKSSKTYTNPDTGRKNKVSYGQKGAKIAPGTDKGDSYCARSNGIKKGLSKDKQNDPHTPNNLSRKKWKCSGDKSMKEAISLDIEVGDIVLGGKYKNKRMEVKEIGTDELGQPTINGKPILKFRIEKHLPDEKKSKKTLEAEKETSE